MKANTAAFSAMDLRTLFGDRAVVPDFHASIGVCTDTRSLQPGCLFVALKGERFDAHDHIHKAILYGAVGIVFEERWLSQWESGPGKTFPSFARIVVPDCLVALGDLAHYHRKRFSIPVIAVAGANGKTTTKDLSAAVLSHSYLTLKTEANYNNRVGTPLTLLQLTKYHGAAVIEIGTNEPGEIEVLADMVAPTHGIITNIGEEHLEKLHDLDGVEKEETALYRYCQQQQATALVNMDDERLKAYSGTFPNQFHFGTNDGSDLNASISFDTELHPELKVQSAQERCTVPTSLVGYAAATNAVAALAIGVSVGISLADSTVALANYEAPPVHGYARMQIQRMRTTNATILNDCYNANPASMRMALRTLQAFPADKRIAVLGDMRELGEHSDTAHQAIIAEALQHCDVLILLGRSMADAAHVVGAADRAQSTGKQFHFAENVEVAAQLLNTSCTAADAILVKASRGMALENLIDLLV